MRLNKFFLSVLLMISVSSFAFSKGKDEVPSLRGVTAITEVIGDGQKVAALSLEYSTDIDSASLDLSDFSVPNHEVTAVYLNNRAAREDKGEGNYVIVELKLVVIPKLDGPGNHAPEEGEGEGGPGGPAPVGEVVDDSPEPVILSADIRQTGEIASENGTILPASDELNQSDNTINPIVEDFQQLVFEDPGFGGKSLTYNLYIPENYDPEKVYPLVLFIHDAGVVSNNPIATLTQGLGAVVWASPEEQAKHECFVLAPQYNCTIVGDGSQTTDEVEMTVNLVNMIAEKYSIDTDRMYNTGQSMGGMTSIAINIRYPELFAASWLVACQWDPSKVSPMAGKPLWIVVSEGDTKAYPGQEAITAELIKYGATVTKDSWDARSDLDEQAQHVSEMLINDTSIYYTVFEGGSHQYTWQYAYSLEGIRDWLFEQHK